MPGSEIPPKWLSGLNRVVLDESFGEVAPKYRYGYLCTNV